MVMERKGHKSDVGVIIGRFQVPRLHDGHVELVETVKGDCERVIIVVGLSALKATRRNTLDYAARKAMLEEKFPEVLVVYQDDMPDDKAWSKKLDKLIEKNTAPGAKVTLYGSRDAFIGHYSGRYPVVELLQKSYVSGTVVRDQIAHQTAKDERFREGAFWATQNQYSNPIGTVDIAIVDGDRLLLGHKKDDTGFRFVGGFINCGETAEQAAARETHEETGLDIGGEAGLKYVSSCVIDDWRYRGEDRNILTFFYVAPRIFGRPEPQDDIDQLEWFEIEELAAIEDDDYGKVVVKEHIPLMKLFIDKVVRPPQKEVKP
jgi:bifunctional NMN adenylyltransferase/nudix hydrolase